MSKEFEDIRVGSLFHVNGNDYQKKSTRTAMLLSCGKTFYFRKNEVVHPIAY